MEPMAAAIRDRLADARSQRGMLASAVSDGLMVFDGVCDCCSANVRFRARIDRAHVLRFASIRSPYGRHLAGCHGIDPDEPSIVVFFGAGRPVLESNAVLTSLSQRHVSLDRAQPPPPVRQEGRPHDPVAQVS